MDELTKGYIDARLGNSVLVNGTERGIISYEHNVGRLALYSADEWHLIKFIEKGDRIIFETGDGVERIVSSEIKE
ncbi:hypothetical protein J4422_03140 [Candidatus Pacearchaeota archaeon]|nr:hypothetical protein [Candidatus Pacearchaeota archaeon]